MDSQTLQSLAEGVAAGITLTLTHAYALTRDNPLAKGGPFMSSTNPAVAAIQAELPKLLEGFEALAKIALDYLYKGTPAEKAAAFTAQFQPAFNDELTKLGLPTWMDGTADALFAGVVAKVVGLVESVPMPGAEAGQ